MMNFSHAESFNEQMQTGKVFPIQNCQHFSPTQNERQNQLGKFISRGVADQGISNGSFFGHTSLTFERDSIDDSNHNKEEQDYIFLRRSTLPILNYSCLNQPSHLPSLLLKKRQATYNPEIENMNLHTMVNKYTQPEIHAATYQPSDELQSLSPGKEKFSSFPKMKQKEIVGLNSRFLDEDEKRVLQCQNNILNTTWDKNESSSSLFKHQITKRQPASDSFEFILKKTRDEKKQIDLMEKDMLRQNKIRQIKQNKIKMKENAIFKNKESDNMLVE